MTSAEGIFDYMRKSAEALSAKEVIEDLMAEFGVSSKQADRLRRIERDWTEGDLTRAEALGRIRRVIGKEESMEETQRRAKGPARMHITEMARKVTDDVALAFKQGRPKRSGNTHTDGKVFYLHGNPIVKREGVNIYVSLAGWPTVTTRERINGVLSALGIDGRVSQSAGKQMLNGEEWDGSWTFVGKAPVVGTEESRRHPVKRTTVENTGHPVKSTRVKITGSHEKKTKARALAENRNTGSNLQGKSYMVEEDDWRKARADREEQMQALFPNSDAMKEDLEKLIDWDGRANAVSMFDEENYDGDATSGQDLDLPYWIEEQWDSHVSGNGRNDVESSAAEALRALMKMMPDLQEFAHDPKNGYLSWSESSGMMPYGDCNAPDDAIILEIWGEDYEPEVQLDLHDLVRQFKIAKEDEEKFKQWLKLVSDERHTGLKDYDGKSDTLWAYTRFQCVAATYLKLDEVLEVAEKALADVAPEERQKAEELMDEMREGAGGWD